MPLVVTSFSILINLWQTLQALTRLFYHLPILSYGFNTIEWVIYGNLPNIARMKRTIYGNTLMSYFSIMEAYNIATAENK